MDEPEQTGAPAPGTETEDQDIRVGSATGVSTPVRVLYSGRQMMALPVFARELDAIRNSSVFGGLTAGLAFFFLGTFINYSIALQASGITLDVKTAARFEAYAYACKHLSWFFGLIAMFLQIKVANSIREIKKIE